MAKLDRFEDLDVWQAARHLADGIHMLSRQGPFRQDQGFRDQIRRAAVSVVSNIAEGFERRSNGQFAHFLDIAAGSAGEVRAQLYLALDFGYLDEPRFRELFDEATRISRMLAKLMQYLKTLPDRSPSPRPRRSSRQSSSLQTPNLPPISPTFSPS